MSVNLNNQISLINGISLNPIENRDQELKELKTNAKELFEAYRKEWGYSDPNENIYVYGKVDITYSNNGAPLHWLIDPISEKNHKKLDLGHYEFDSEKNFVPVDKNYRSIKIFIPKHDNDLNQGDLVKAKIKLALKEHIIKKHGIGLEARTIEKVDKNQLKELNDLIQDLERLKDEIEIISSKKARQSSAYEEITKNIVKSKKELDLLKCEIRQNTENRDKLNTEVTELTNKRAFLGFKDSIKQKPTIFETRYSYNLAEIANRAHSALISSDCIYSRSLIKDFTALLCTHDVIVLAGSSGTGKTLLCREYARVTGNKATIIPVKPNWTSADDLIGYYNPIEKRFNQTEFVDAIKEAQTDPDKLHLICLDEMNLARPEYYFADFLSLLENRTTQRQLRLNIPSKFYLKDFDKINMELSSILPFDIKENDQLDKLLEDSDRRDKLFKLLKVNNKEEFFNAFEEIRDHNSNKKDSRYLEVPNNVRFIGTMNVDETTNFFAPKILDRVHILRLESPIFVNIEADKTYDGKSFIAKSHSFSELQDYPKIDHTCQITKDLLSMRDQILKPLRIDVSIRLIRQSQNYANQAKKCDISYSAILSNVIKHKILPRCVFDTSFGNSSVNPEKQLKLLSENYDLTSETKEDIKRLIDMQDELDTINWWL